ncbi:serine/threonine-protein kinase [Arthrobacter mobilis]|uniref:Serine/threonine protein kinase n=1 Tax=Arthrobacter mobilis TaxID=2724944 RepID=A0A7X6K6G6_9MICC|nr:serine/threonine-protein kinase [Arthrobacter mobilis]NKX55764.1 serine/threonine protein kinase [Arthrobacter mobilis]
MGEGFAGQTLPGVIGGRYKLQELIGRGSSAAVYKGQDDVLGRDVAVKIFHPQVTDADELRRQQGEIELLATFNHPGLVTVYDAGTDTSPAGESRTFVVMELAGGTDLRRQLRMGALPPADVARIGAQLGQALEYVHRRGVIHRDIKPGNIALSAGDGEPRAKLMDFGIARAIEGTRLTATGKTVGTANYLSPEQAKGEALGTASDIYSLGLVLLECLTGKVEYPGSAVESAVARLQRRPQVPAELGPGWVKLLRAMTAMDPAGRPGAGQAAEALAGLAETVLPAAAAAPGEHRHTAALSAAPARHPRRLRRHAAWLVPAALLLAAAAVLAPSVIADAGQPGPPVPEPSPALTGNLEEHMRELERTLTP